MRHGHHSNVALRRDAMATLTVVILVKVALQPLITALVLLVQGMAPAQTPVHVRVRALLPVQARVAHQVVHPEGHLVRAQAVQQAAHRALPHAVPLAQHQGLHQTLVKLTGEGLLLKYFKEVPHLSYLTHFL